MKIANLRKYCFRIYWIVKKKLTPTLKFSQVMYGNVLRSYLNSEVKWLDTGCGHKILPEWCSSEEKNLVKNCKFIVGIDYDLHSLVNHNNLDLKVRGRITELPFKNDYFDLITANMVVEHLDNPEEQFKEVWRVLGKNGILIFHTPNVYGYTTFISRLFPKIIKNKLIYYLQGRGGEDVFDTYYKANSRKTIERLSESIGFEVVKIEMIVSDAQLVMFPPIVVFELIWIKILMMKTFKPLRTNIIAVLKKVPKRYNSE